MSTPAFRWSPANKYGARRQWSDLCQRWFASKAEARRGEQLWLMQMAGEIHDLTFQPRFDLLVERIDQGASEFEHHAATSVGRYVADAEYVTKAGRYVVEDVKGGAATKTPVYRLKKKLMLACWGITISEVEV